MNVQKYLEQFTSLMMPCGIKPSEDMVDLIRTGSVLMRHSEGGWQEWWFRTSKVLKVPHVPEGYLVLWMPSDGMYVCRPWGDILETMDDLDDIEAGPTMMGWTDEGQIPQD